MSGNRKSGMPKPAAKMPVPTAPAAPVEGAAVVDAEAVAKPARQARPVQKSNSPIEVVAIRAGVIKQSRKEIGAVFTMPSMESLGSWMKCLDPKLQAVHEHNMKAKAKAGK